MTKQDLRRFYVYAFTRSQNSEYGKKGSPYYVGKGSGNRAWCNSRRGFQRPKDDSRIIVLRAGLLESEAFEWESFYIRHYGRIDIGTGILRNLTDGGEGTSGRKASLETRQKISQATKGNKKWLGRRHTPEARAKMSRTKTGKKGKPLSRRHRNMLYQSTLRYLYEFIDSNGEIYITDNIQDFARQYNLDYSHLSKVAHGKRARHKSWTGRIAEVLR
jgi:hypothetical protein